MNERKVVFGWLTVEVALYGLILCLALAVRLGGLQLRVMDVPEAEGAWQAWHLANGERAAGAYSPLLLPAQALLFSLFGASDVAARLVPALAGSALVVLPYLARASLGRYGALATALSLALSPTLAYSSRTAGGTGLLVAAVLGAWVLWTAYQRERRVGYLLAAAVMCALALIADARVISVLVVGAVAWAAERALFGRNGFRLEVEGQEPDHGQRIALVAGGVLLLAATALTLNLDGLGAWAEFPMEWFGRLAPVINGQPWHYPLRALILYEPFLVVFGILGAIDVLSRRETGALLMWVAAGLLVLALVAGGRGPEDIALICLPLALLAGRAIERLTMSWVEEGRLTREGLFVLVLLGIGVYISLETAFYARALYTNLPQSAQFLWFWLLAVAVLVILAGMSLAWFGGAITWRAVGAVVALALTMYSFSAMTGLNFHRANDPRELHVLAASDVGVRDLIKVMTDLSYRHQGYPISTPVTVESAMGPVVRWYLRDWERVTFVDALSTDVRTPMVLSTEAGWKPSERYVGQDFVTYVWWSPSQLVANDRVSWWLYRKSIEKPIPIQKAVLWMQAEEAAASE